MNKMILIGLMFISGSVMATATTPNTKEDANIGYEINRRIAQKFCGGNEQCAAFAAIELEDAYKAGRAEKRDHRAWDLSIAKFARTKRNLCDNAPDKKMCWAYRDTLLGRYMAGLAARD